MCGLTKETGSEEWPPLGNEGLFLVPSVDCKLSPLSASAERARYPHLVDADHSSLRDSHVPKSSSSFRKAPRWGPDFGNGRRKPEQSGLYGSRNLDSSLPLMRVNTLICSQSYCLLPDQYGTLQGEGKWTCASECQSWKSSDEFFSDHFE